MIRGGPRMLLALALTALAPTGFATTYLQLSPQAMLAKAGLVFVGTVTDVSVTNQGGRPWTRVRFRVDTPLEGVPVDAQGKASQPVELSFLGGAVPGGPTLTVSGMPQFSLGEKVLLFAYDQAYASPIVGFRQGLWKATPAGLKDEDGAPLSVSPKGELVRGGSGASLDAVLGAIRSYLGGSGSTP